MICSDVLAIAYISLQPLVIRERREKNGGKNAAMGVMYLEKRGRAKDVADDWRKESTRFDSQTSDIFSRIAKGPLSVKIKSEDR